MRRTKARLYFTVMLMLLVFSASFAAQKKDKNKEKGNPANLPEVIWRDPGDVASLNLLYGAGGKEHAPDPNGKFTFVKEDKQGTSPKFDIKDEQGVQWKVKLGQEPQSETAATRLLWAAGYFVDEDYYLAEFKVAGMPKLGRGSNFVSADGTVHKARLERKPKGVKKLGDWGWFDNPFLNKRELNGLRIMMSLLNNWDLKRVNNSIYEVDGERRYVVSDVGGTLGNTGNRLSRSKSDSKEYANSKFIGKSGPDFVDFVLHARSDMEKVTQHIPRADVKWLAQRLSQLSEEQIRDCFRAGGYAPEDVTVYTEAVRKRIAELAAL
ncbi:MAG: DUF493 domain-containing protein [Acidobacteriia bacterium]|nr:DUF493 domain-containing protein [Terriglobia bacterium]